MENNLKQFGLRWLYLMFDSYLYRLSQISVIVTTLGLLVFGLFGSFHMVQRFDPHKMLPSDNYLR